jgi:putative membrane protein
MSWHVHPDVLLWIALIEGAYLYGLRAVGGPRGLRATPGQITWFTSGVLVLYLTAATPMHDLAEQRLLLMEMLQHLLFTLVAPPLLLLGTPGWLLRPLLVRNRFVFPVARLLTRPLVAFVIFNVTLLGLHLPFSAVFFLQHHFWHFFDHAALVATATLMWWPVFSPLPELPRLSPPMQMLYLFVQSFVPTVLASFMTFSHTLLYPFYATVPRTWGISAQDDQLIAGLIMKLGGGAILWLVIGIVFFTWVAQHDRAARQAEHDPMLSWDDVEKELDRMGLTPGGRKPS